MTDQQQPDTETSTTSPMLRAFAAVGMALGTLGIVAGLGGMIWLQSSSNSHAASGNGATKAASVAAPDESQQFLHAQGNWPSVPRAEDVFANQPDALVDDAPAPTF